MLILSCNVMILLLLYVNIDLYHSDGVINQILELSYVEKMSMFIKGLNLMTFPDPLVGNFVMHSTF